MRGLSLSAESPSLPGCSFSSLLTPSYLSPSPNSVPGSGSRLLATFRPVPASCRQRPATCWLLIAAESCIATAAPVSAVPALTLLSPTRALAQTPTLPGIPHIETGLCRDLKWTTERDRETTRVQASDLKHSLPPSGYSNPALLGHLQAKGLFLDPELFRRLKAA